LRCVCPKEGEEKGGKGTGERTRKTKGSAGRESIVRNTLKKG